MLFDKFSEKCYNDFKRSGRHCNKKKMKSTLQELVNL